MKREVKIGLTLLTAILSVYFIVIWVKGIHFFATPSKTYYIKFDNVNGLLKGDMVSIFGYQSGRVTNIEPQSDGVKVTIALNEDIILHSDAVAQLQMKEIMGGKVIEIQPGKSPTLLNEKSFIASTPAMDMLQMSAKMGNMMSEFQTEELKKIFLNMEKITQKVAETSEQIPVSQWAGMMKDMEKLLINANQLTMSAQQLTETATEFSNRRWDKEIDLLVQQKDTSFQQIYQLTQQSQALMRQTDITLREISEITHRAQSSTNTADSVLRNGGKILNQIEKLLTLTQSALNQIDKTIRVAENQHSVANKIMTDEAFSQKLDSLVNSLNTALNMVKEGKLKVSVSLNRKILTEDEVQIMKNEK